MDLAGSVETATFAGYSRRTVIALVAFAVAVVVEVAVVGPPTTPERFVVLPLVAALVLGRARPYVRDFLPFVLLVLLYEELRGVAHLLHPHPYYRPQIRAEEWLFNGHLPTIELQHWLWSGHLRFYDHLITGFSSVHFFVPPALAFFLWLKDRALFVRFVRTYLVLSYAAALTFLLFPAAPPWAAARAGDIPPVALLSGPPSTQVGKGLILPNPYAAIPSLHAGYALLVFLFVALYARRFRWRWPITLVAALYPVTMGFCRVYTGDHYVVDLLIGFAFTIGAFVWVPALGRRRVPSLRIRFAAALATAVLALTLATALAAAATGGALRPDVADTLSRSFTAVAGTRSTVDLARLVPFAWSRVYVFPASTPPATIDRALGFSWLEAPAADPAPAPPGVALLVFVRTGVARRDVVREVRYEAANVHLDCLMGSSFPRTAARFQVAMRYVAPFGAYRHALVPANGLGDVAPGCLRTPPPGFR